MGKLTGDVRGSKKAPKNWLEFKRSLSFQSKKKKEERKSHILQKDSSYYTDQKQDRLWKGIFIQDGLYNANTCEAKKISTSAW